MQERKRGHFRNHLKPWSLAVVDAIAKHPVSVEEAIAIGVEKVPPGRGYRRARVKTNKVPAERSTARGSAQIVKDSIRIMVTRGSIRKFELDGKVYCELTDAGKWRLTVGRSR